MDAKQASELLDGLPISSGLATEVFHEAVHRYVDAFQKNESSEKEFDERRAHAILTAKFRDEHIPPDESGNWILAALSFPEKDCLAAGLSIGVGIKSWMQPGNPGWLVAAWIPRELLRYETTFREPLPLPQNDGFTDCSLTEQEWLVVFWAMFESNPENQKRSFVPRSLVEASLPELSSNIHRRRPIEKLMKCLKSVGTDDLSRFKVGRESVIATLLDQCLRHALEEVRRGPNGFKLIEFDNDSANHPKPDWLTVWRSPYWPTADNLEAASQWLVCTKEALLHWQVSFQGAVENAEETNVVSAQMARQARMDAWVLACHVHDNHGIVNGPPEATDDSLSAVIRYLDGLRRAISEPDIKKPPSPSLKDIPRGVSLLDAALSVNEGDDAAAQEAKKRWGRIDLRPAPIGRDLNQSQTELYEVGALVDWIFSIEDNLDPNKKKTCKDSLNRIRRTIADDAGPSA